LWCACAVNRNALSETTDGKWSLPLAWWLVNWQAYHFGAAYQGSKGAKEAIARANTPGQANAGLK